MGRVSDYFLNPYYQERELEEVFYEADKDLLEMQQKVSWGDE
jgi:hypothetical protein